MRINILKVLQDKVTENVMKDLDNRYIYTGHSLIFRTIDDVKKDAQDNIDKEISRLKGVIKYYA